jgi:hypothetical protein
MNDYDLMMSQIIGKRLTWNQLTGKAVSPTQAF